MKARHKDTGEIIELAEEGIISRDGRRFCWYQVELITEPIDECKPSLPSDLDEASFTYENDLWESGFKDSGYTPQEVKDAFKAGAERMAGQAEKDTINRACKWLFSHLPILVDYYDEDIHEKADRSEFIKLFRTQMEEQK